MRGERPITKKQAGLPRVTLWRPEWDGTPSALLFEKRREAEAEERKIAKALARERARSGR